MCIYNNNNEERIVYHRKPTRRLSLFAGDSGGPIMKQYGNNFVLVGLTSWGPPDCASALLPGVMVDIPWYSEWIRQNIRADTKPVGRVIIDNSNIRNHSDQMKEKKGNNNHTTSQRKDDSPKENDEKKENKENNGTKEKSENDANCSNCLLLVPFMVIFCQMFLMSLSK